MTFAHGQYVCRCGRKLAGCHCPEHKNMVAKVYQSCINCEGKPYDPRPLKEKLKIEEK